MDASISQNAWRNFEDLKEHVDFSAILENKADEVVDKILRKNAKVGAEQYSAVKPFRIFVTHKSAESPAEVI